MDRLIDEMYEKFKGYPSSRPIVRNGQRNDAFEVVVLKILYGKILDLSFDAEHVDELAKYIIAPPDSGIDIFVEKENGDETVFDVIQVKNKELTESELRTALSDMERTISDFCRAATNVASQNCREILSNSNLEKNNKGSCQYYVVHTGSTRDFSGLKDNEHILNVIDLEVLSEGNQDKVKEDILTINGERNFLKYGSDNEGQNAIICNINAYDLAELNNKYYSTEIGRNILFGHNLRESLNPKTSKSFGAMKKTIKDCPSNFWYFNNGITIVAEDVAPSSSNGVTTIKLSRFSIVNGAQTTSSLGLILQEAKRDRNAEIEAALKNAFVLARVLKVSDIDTENSIAIYNNTQNPINNRDMVANNAEQKKLSEWMIDTTYPQIYVEIRRGSKAPNTFNKLFVHRKTTNEILAQLAYAGFYIQPHTAKDKKSALFFNDTSQEQFTMNEVYHKIFNFVSDDSDDNGILFKKSKSEIDELLFTQQFYKEGKTYLRKVLQDRLVNERNEYEAADSDEKVTIRSRIERDECMLDTVGICLFYFVAAYFEITGQNRSVCAGKRYDYEKFYQDKAYREGMIADASNFFLMKTIEILMKNAKENGKSSNMNNWVRGANCQKCFLETLRDNIGFDDSIRTRYTEFATKYKVVPI